MQNDIISMNCDWNIVKELCSDHQYEILSKRDKKIRIHTFSDELFFDSKLEKEVSKYWDKIGKDKRNGDYVVFLGLDDLGGMVNLNLAHSKYANYRFGRENTEHSLYGIGAAAISHIIEEDGKKISQPKYIFAEHTNKAMQHVEGGIEIPPGGAVYYDLVKKYFSGENKEDPLLGTLKKKFKEEFGLDYDKRCLHCDYLGIVVVKDYKSPNSEIKRFNDVAVNYSIGISIKNEDELKNCIRTAGDKYGGKDSKVDIIPESELPNYLKENRNYLAPRTKLTLWLLSEYKLKK